MSKVINYVKENYVDPKRIKPKEMMLGALEAIEQAVPEVIIEGTPESSSVKVTVGTASRDFDLTRLDSLWKMSYNFKDIFDFIEKNMKPIDEPREVEYAAINGALQTLDPHSMLLRPEQYMEMKTTTKGEFGGLGFVVQMKEGILTVVRVLPKTPAARSGIRKQDQILRIGDESTMNMSVIDAVSRLRGPIDSKIALTIARKSWEKPQTISVTRALINIESVASKLYPQGIGYVRLFNFQGNTARDLEVALQELDDKAKRAGSPDGLKGLVIDLRGNPGGLLEQALQISDFFIANGNIVTTVGLSDKLRVPRPAHVDESDNAYPVAVLVNEGSASASEIVAGALKNNDRAVVIGRPTFGKGSVQMLYDFPDDSALKLTIAKYLTPGDISIQEVGIVPDIQLDGNWVTKDGIRVFAPRRATGEADLEHHFSNPSSAQAAKKREDVKPQEKPSEVLAYIRDEPASAKADAGTDDPADDEAELGPEVGGEIRDDYEINFARDLLSAAPALTRNEQLTRAKEFIADRRAVQRKRLAEEFQKLGVDWSEGPSHPQQLAVTMKPESDKRFLPGETVPVELTVENRGTTPVYRLRGWLETDNPWLDRREFAFGLLRPGEKRSWTVSVKLPKNILARQDAVLVKLQDDGGAVAEMDLGVVSMNELPRPKFGYGWTLIDACAACNQDGRAQRGETVSVAVDVTNNGPGKAYEVAAVVRNGSDANIFLETGRFKLGEMAPGETKTARFNIEVKPAYKADDFVLKLSVLDEKLDEYMVDNLKIPVTKEAGPTINKRSPSLVRLAAKTPLYASVDEKRVFATLTKPAVVTETGREGKLVRVDVGGDRFAFVRQSDVKPEAAHSKQAKPAPLKDLAYVPVETPAVISLNVDSVKGGLSSSGEKFTLSGTLTGKHVQDFYVAVNNRKVLYRARTPEDGDVLKFTADVPLKENQNFVRVVARSSQDYFTQRVLLVRRPPSAVAQKSP